MNGATSFGQAAAARIRRAALITGVGLFAVTLLSGTTAGAQAPRSAPTARPDAPPAPRCDLTQTVTNEISTVLQRIVSIDDQQGPVLGRLGEINSRATKPDVPIVKQLSARDVAEFRALSQRLRTMQLLELVESRRERDLDVLQRMAAMADQNYRFQKVIREGDPDFVVWSFLILMRLLGGDEVPTPAPVAEICDLDRSLWLMSDVELERSAVDFASFNRLSAQFRQKYGFTGPINPERLSGPDKDRYNEVSRNAIGPGARLKNFIVDTENLRRANRASLIIYETGRDDVAKSGGDIAALGTSVARMMSAENFPQDMAAALGMWRAVNEKIPPRVVREWEAISNAVGR